VFSIPFILINTLISSLFKEKINRIISVVLSIFITLIYISQYIYFEFYDSIFSIYSIKEGTGQVFGEFFSAILKMVLDNIWVTLLFLLPFLLFIIFGKKIFNFERNKKASLITSGLSIVSIAISILFVQFYGSGMYNLKRLYKETHAPMITINKVGLLSMEVLDLDRFIFGFEEKLYNINKPTDNKEETKKPEETEEIKYNVLDIDFDKLINEEENSMVKSMHEYFKNVIPTKQNEYTGIFKGKNLIYITAEGFDKIAIDESLTPTLYKLANNGFVFENYYQPLFTVSTSDGEYMFLNSLIPKEGVWSFYRSSNIYMPFGVGNVFKREGYSTVNAYHDHTYTYYNRDKSHPNLGFDKYIGCGNGLEELINCKTWPESDIEMINATVDDYINSDNFMTYYMTVSGHLNYTFTGNYISYKNKDLVKDLPYTNHVKAYLAANIELDRAIESLINNLKEKGKLDDTVIVISPDHYPYGLKTSELNEISDTDRSDKFEMFHTSLILYNSEIEENVKVTKYVSSIDVLPTIYNLFGIKYDSRLLMGRDALSDAEGLVILSDRSFINEFGSYNSITGKYTKFKEDVSNDYIEKLNHEVYQRFTMSSLLLYEKNGVYLDYYRKLGLYED
jgi:phosphoglycerol transferase MdoB-like AlkP superfamily enzyme